MADICWGEAYFLPGCFDLSLRLEAGSERWWRKASSKTVSWHCKPALANEIDSGAAGRKPPLFTEDDVRELLTSMV